MVPYWYNCPVFLLLKSDDGTLTCWRMSRSCTCFLLFFLPVPVKCNPLYIMNSLGSGIAAYAFAISSSVVAGIPISGVSSCTNMDIVSSWVCIHKVFRLVWCVNSSFSVEPAQCALGTLGVAVSVSRGVPLGVSSWS